MKEDAERNADADKRANLQGNVARKRRVHMARAGFVEHQSDGIRPGRNGTGRIPGAGDTANFNASPHPETIWEISRLQTS